jgi:signal transduction histidine kinase
LRWTRSGRLPEYCLEPLEISIKEVERLNDSVTGVLQLSKTQDSPRELVGLHKLLDEAADLVVSRFRRQNVGLSLSLDAEADLVLARPGQLKSAALNLMVNALEAQPGGGHLEIRTTLSRMEELGGPVVSLHFKDEGPGVPADIRDRVFEPFFTHKPGGAGIGLAMAKQSVEENGGQLVLAPSFARKEGAEFVVILPLASFEAMAGIQDFSRDYRSKPPIRVSGTDPNRADEEMEEKAVAPRYLLTPAGLKTALPLSFPDPEERN